MRGIALAEPDRAEQVCRLAFERGLILETCGPAGEVIKLMPPLNINPCTLTEGMGILRASISDVLK